MQTGLALRGLLVTARLAMWMAASAACGSSADGTLPSTSVGDTRTDPVQWGPSHVAEVEGDAASADALGTAPDDWAWLDFPDSRCANGSSTGIAVNRHPNASHLLVFLQGGGACVGAESCWRHPTAANLNGYYLARLAAELSRVAR